MTAKTIEAARIARAQVIDPEYQADMRDLDAEYVNRQLDRMRRVIAKNQCGLMYSAESEARILRVTDELRRAYAEARMVPLIPKCSAEGNVIQFPSKTTA
jgi:hypothetical protein